MSAARPRSAASDIDLTFVGIPVSLLTTMSPLFVAATPIGNVGDASMRLRQGIESADLIAAEDSRKFHRLASDLGIRFNAKVLSFFDGNESDRVPGLVEEIRAGKNVLLISDAGTPGVSDPGYRLIREVIAAGLPFTVIPGASAVLTALLYSGSTTSKFAFDGFLPRSEVALEKYFMTLKAEERTLVSFESPKRLVRTLEIAERVLGDDRKIAICREMTKTYEEIFRGTLSTALSWARARDAGEGIKGEITLVLAPREVRSEPSEEEIRERAKELFDDGLSSKEISIRLASEFEMSKRDAYDLANSLRNSKEESAEA